MIQIYFGLGTNLGVREDNLRAAIREISKDFTIEKSSPIYESEPVGVVNQPKFLNMVLRTFTDIAAHDVLARLKEIEKRLGRVKSEINGPRLIDIDILFYGDAVIETNDLVIPHPRLQERAFVMVPMMDVAPELMHPIFKKSIRELSAALGDFSHAVRRINISI